MRIRKTKPALAAAVLALLVLFALAFSPVHANQSDPLPSWAEGPTKSAIIQFVQDVTKQGGPDYVRPEERIATFDNDGTLWSEQPAYFQLFFAIDRVKALAPEHPEWKTKQPFKAVLADDPTYSKIYLVRHAQAGVKSQWKGKDRKRPLDRRGRKQAIDLAVRFKAHPITTILTSPYQRCLQTAKPLENAIRLSAETDNRLDVTGSSDDFLRLVRGLKGEAAVVITHGVLNARAYTQLPTPSKTAHGQPSGL